MTAPAAPVLRPLLVGEANPWQSDERLAMRYALHPDPPHASGGRLCFKVMCLDEATYLRSFDRVDLCHPKWSMPKARTRANELRDPHRPAIVLLGAKVCAAFGEPYDPFSRFHHGGVHFVILPHPSGLNRAWQQPGAYERARSVLREAGVLPAIAAAVAS